MKDDDVAKRILERRAAFVRAALAGVGLAGAAGCDGCNPPEVCLSPPALPPTTGADASASATSASAAPLIDPPPPDICLSPPARPSLHLARMELDDAALRQELDKRTEGLHEIAEVDLRGNRITAAGLRSLAAALSGPVTALDASRNPIGNAGAKAIASEEAFASLSRLRLDRCGLTSAGVEALFGDDSRLRGPSQVALGFNAIGDAGLRALAASPKAAKIGSLYLDKTGISRAGIEALARSEHFERVYEVTLRLNGLEQADIDLLRTAEAFARARIEYRPDNQTP